MSNAWTLLREQRAYHAGNAPTQVLDDLVALLERFAQKRKCARTALKFYRDGLKLRVIARRGKVSVGGVKRQLFEARQLVNALAGEQTHEQ